MYKHILIPTDGSKLAEEAVDSGLKFAEVIGARVTGFVALPTYRVGPDHAAETAASVEPVISFQEYEKHSRENAHSILARMENLARSARVEFEFEFALSDHPYAAIVEAANKHGCDLIFMASHGYGGLRLLLHGSQTLGVLTHSRIPTLVYR